MEINKEKEKQLVLKALRGDREELVTYLEPTIDKIAKRYAENHAIKKLGITKDECKKAALVYLELALTKYNELIIESEIRTKTIAKFKTFIMTFAKQGIDEYCESKKI